MADGTAGTAGTPGALSMLRRNRLRTGLAVGGALLLLLALVVVNPSPDGARRTRTTDTVPSIDGATAASPAGDDPATPEIESAGEGAGPGAAAAPAKPAVPGAPGASRQGDASSGGSGGGQSSPSGAMTGCNFDGCGAAQGITDTTIKIGFLVIDDANQAASSFGFETSVGDERRMVTILVDDLNRRGGLAGRKVVPFVTSVSALSSDRAGEINRACVEFTQDQKVFAVIPDGQLSDPLLHGCLAKHRTLSLSPGGIVTDDQEIQLAAPWAQLPNGKAFGRVHRTLITKLNEAGFFSKWSVDGGAPKETKVGLMVLDYPPYVRTANNIDKPLLARNNITVGDEFRFPLTAYSDPSQMQGQMAQAVLRFKQKDITHVLFLPGFFSSQVFLQNAESQGYRPRYAFESFMFPEANAQSATKVQLRGMMGIGWMPGSDVADSRHPYSDSEKRCFELMQKGGENAKARGSRANLFCDMVWLLEAAVGRAAGPLNAGAVVNSLAGLSTWSYYDGFPADFTKGTMDAKYTHRLFAFDDACGCVNYKSPPTPDVQ